MIQQTYVKLCDSGLVPQCIQVCVERIAGGWGYPISTWVRFGFIWNPDRRPPRYFVGEREVFP